MPLFPTVRDSFTYAYPEQLVTTDLQTAFFNWLNQVPDIVGVIYIDADSGPVNVLGYNLGKIIAGELVTLKSFLGVAPAVTGRLVGNIIHGFNGAGDYTFTIDTTDDSVTTTLFDLSIYFDQLDLSYVGNSTKSLTSEHVYLNGTLWIGGNATVGGVVYYALMEFGNPANIVQTAIDLQTPISQAIQQPIVGRFYGANNLTFSGFPMTITNFVLTAPNAPVDEIRDVVIFGNELDDLELTLRAKDSGGWFYTTQISDTEFIAIYLLADGSEYDRYDITGYTFIEYFSAASPPFIIGSGFLQSTRPAAMQVKDAIGLPCFVPCLPYAIKKEFGK